MSRTHGQAGTRAHIAWLNMKARCSKPNLRAANRYIGRGIRVDPAFSTFEGFYKHLGQCPDGYTLERIDNDGHYEPGNVKWATMDEQRRNRSDNRRLAFNGENLTLAEWAGRTGISLGTIWARLARGWDPVKTLTAPLVSLSESGRTGAHARWHNRGII